MIYLFENFREFMECVLESCNVYRQLLCNSYFPRYSQWYSNLLCVPNSVVFPSSQSIIQLDFLNQRTNNFVLFESWNSAIDSIQLSQLYTFTGRQAFCRNGKHEFKIRGISLLFFIWVLIILNWIHTVSFDP